MNKNSVENRPGGGEGAAHLVLLVLLQQLAAVPEQLLQAQLRLPALPHALGEVCHQAVGTGRQCLAPPSTHHPPWEPGKTGPHTQPQGPPLQSGSHGTCTKQDGAAQ